MAIIACPECGENISNKAEHCIHCGCKIITCPECETVYIQEVPVCTECGYAFQKKPAPVTEVMQKPEETGPKFKTLGDVNAAWSKHLAEQNGKDVLSILVPILCLVPLGLVILWKIWPSILPGYFTTLAVAQLCLVGFAICLFISSVRDSFVDTPIQKAIRFKFWADREGIDLRALIQQEIMTEKKDLTLDQCSSRLGLIRTMVSNIVNAEDPGRQRVLRIKSVVDFLLWLIVGILSFAFLFCNVPLFMAFGWSAIIRWWWLIAAIGISFLPDICDEVYSETELWIHRNMPDAAESFEGIVAEHRRLEKLSKKYGKDEINDNKLR